MMEPLYASTVESLELPIRTPADPTAALPQFSVTEADAVEPGTFYDGAWATSWSPTSKLAVAITPTMGSDAATITLTSGTVYAVWAKVTLGYDIAVWKVDVFPCA